MVSTAGQTSLRPEGTIISLGQVPFTGNEPERLNPKHNLTVGDYIHVLCHRVGRPFYLTFTEECLSGESSLWRRSEQPNLRVLEFAETVETTHASLLNWLSSNHPNRSQETGLPPACDLAGRLIETVAWYDEVKTFSQGFKGEIPSGDTVRMGNQIVKAAIKQTVESEFYVDDSDGALGFMLRLKNGLLLLAELSIDGTLSGGTYDDNKEAGTQIEFLPNATVEQMANLF